MELTFYKILSREHMGYEDRASIFKQRDSLIFPKVHRKFNKAAKNLLITISHHSKIMSFKVVLSFSSSLLSKSFWFPGCPCFGSCCFLLSRMTYVVLLYISKFYLFLKNKSQPHFYDKDFSISPVLS
jgi:hypothetical protein